MSTPDTVAEARRTGDPRLDSAREIVPDADYVTIALAAVMMNRGLITVKEIRDRVMKARAFR